MTTSDSIQAEFQRLATQRSRFVLFPLLTILLVAWISVIEPVYAEFSKALSIQFGDPTSVSSELSRLKDYETEFLQRVRDRHILALGRDELTAERSSTSDAGKAADRCKERTKKCLGRERFLALYGSAAMDNVRYAFFVFANEGERRAFSDLRARIESAEITNRERLKPFNQLKTSSKIDLKFATIALPKYLSGTLWLTLALIFSSIYGLTRVEAFRILQKRHKNSNELDAKSNSNLDLRIDPPAWVAPIIEVDQNIEPNGGAQEAISNSIVWNKNQEKLKNVASYFFISIYILVSTRVLYISIELTSFDYLADQLWGAGVKSQLPYIRMLNYSIFVSSLTVILFTAVKFPWRSFNPIFSKQRRRFLMSFWGASISLLAGYEVLKTGRNGAEGADRVLGPRGVGKYIGRVPRYIGIEIRSRRRAAEVTLDTGFYVNIKSARYVSPNRLPIHLVVNEKDDLEPWNDASKGRILGPKIVNPGNLIRETEIQRIVNGIPINKLSISIEEYSIRRLNYSSKLENINHRKMIESEVLDLLQSCVWPKDNYHIGGIQFSKRPVPPRKLARIFDLYTTYVYHRSIVSRLQTVRKRVDEDLLSHGRTFEMERRKRRILSLEKRPSHETVVWLMPRPLTKDGQDVLSFLIPSG